MNSALLLVIGVAVYFFGVRFLREASFEPLRHKAPPLQRINSNDGIDYVPTKAPVVFGHHFAFIAGAGPIVGPVLGACFGWVPVILWVIFGCVFIGAAETRKNLTQVPLYFKLNGILHKTGR